MIPVTLFCETCSCYFDTGVEESEDLKNPVCENCAEKRACRHEHVRVEHWDIGRADQTGYYDAGERFVCTDCDEEVEGPAPFCRHCFTDVEKESDLDCTGMCRGCAAEYAREFRMEHRECA